MSGPAELSIAVGILVDAGLKATVVLGFGWIAARAMPWGSAAQRHGIWACSFAALCGLPVFAGLRGPEIALDAPWVVGLWALGVAVFAAPMIRGLLTLRGVAAGAVRDPSRSGLFLSAAVTGPITWGWFRPVIVFPTSSVRWPCGLNRAALAHERAHIARRDWAVHMAVWAVSVLFWFHPLVWMARRKLSQEAEHAADDAVLDGGVLPSDYASLLVSLACPRAPSAALGGASWVPSRVRAILDIRSRSARRWPILAIAVVLGGLSVPALGGFPTWSAPQEALTCIAGVVP